MGEQAATRICSNPDCEFGGQPQPLNKVHFAEQAGYAGGLKTRCRACDRKARRERYHRLKKEELAYNKQWYKDHQKERSTYLKQRNHKIMEMYHNATKKETTPP